VDDRACLTGIIFVLQSGIPWEMLPPGFPSYKTVRRRLKRWLERDAFRTAFANFDPEKIARFDAKKIAAMMDNPGIIRNRAKIEGTVASARVYLEIEVREGFSNFLWKFFDGRPQQNGFHSRAQIPAQSPKSVALSKGLKERGFKFCGPTIVYAFCQATGMVNDHLVSCWRHDACAALAHPPAIA